MACLSCRSVRLLEDFLRKRSRLALAPLCCWDQALLPVPPDPATRSTTSLLRQALPSHAAQAHARNRRQDEFGAPKDHINIRILQDMISSIPLILGLGLESESEILMFMWFLIASKPLHPVGSWVCLVGLVCNLTEDVHHGLLHFHQPALHRTSVARLHDVHLGCY